MAITCDTYGQAVVNAFNGKINFADGGITAMLCTSAYTPNLATDAYKSAVVSAEVTGTGYTAGGQTLTGAAATFTAANSWGTTATVSTAYTVGQIVRPATGNGFLYRCAVAGTSGASAPTWPTVTGANVTDGTVTWDTLGFGLIQLTASPPSWPSSTITARYCVIYDATPTSDATRPLIALINFGADVPSGGGTFSVGFDALGFSVLSPT